MDESNTKLTLKQKLYPLGFRHDAQALAYRTLAFIISSVLTSWMMTTVSLSFVSGLGQTVLNGCSLALTTYGLIGNAILIGIDFGCDTLLPQCYGGNKHKMGIVLQRGIIIAAYACLIIWTLMLNANYLLKWIEPDVEVSNITNKFLQMYLIFVPFDALVALLRMYIGCTGRIEGLIYPSLVGNVVNALSHYICLYHLQMGFYAAPVSLTIAYIFIVITSALYIRFSPIYEETWHPISRACLREWSIYLRLAAPGIVLMIMEAWSIEISVLFAATLGSNSLSAQVVVQQIVWLLYLVLSAVGDAGNILIGQHLGASQPLAAINAKNITYTLAVIVIMLNMLFILGSFYWLPFLFNIPSDALSLTRYGLLLAGVVNFFDGMTIVHTGMIKACGMQKYAAPILFIGVYLLELPLAYVFMFVAHLDIFGFWYGTIISQAITNIILFLLIRRIDWEACSKMALSHIQSPAISLLHSTTDSSSLKTTNEQMQLLPLKTYEKSDGTNLKHASASKQRDSRNDISNEMTSDESSTKSFVIKILVLIVLFCVFIFSFINSIAYQ